MPDAEFGTTAPIRTSMVEIGKDGRLFLLNRDCLGGRGQGTNGGDKVVGETTLSGVWGIPRSGAATAATSTSTSPTATWSRSPTA